MSKTESMIIDHDEPGVSIIVPVYNTKQYLSRCIDSIMSQRFTDFELLLIDDGSTDGSGAICDTYAEKDNRIRVFHKENGGVGSARNMGLDNARGEWVYFADADDELLEGCLQSFQQGMRKDVQLILCGLEKRNEQGELLIIRNGNDEIVKILSKEECLYALFDNEFYGYYYLGWMCVWMFRRNLIDAISLRFCQDIKVKEDTLFVAQYICKKVHSCYFTTKPVYRYYESETSIMVAAKNKFEPRYITSFDACVLIYEELKAIYSSHHPLIALSRCTIWDRYYLIKARIKKFKPEAQSLLVSLYFKAIKTTGVKYSVQYQFKRAKRRSRNLVRRIRNR